MVPRLTAEFWVHAYLNRLRLADIPAYVVARGDATAGAVLVVCATLDRHAKALQRSFDPISGDRVWVPLTEGPETEVGMLVARARARDPDLWVLELEDRHGRTLLEEEGLAG